MGTLARNGQVRPLQMDADNTIDPFCNRPFNRVNRSACALGRICDQGRQKRRRAQPAMRLCHDPQTRDRLVIVEHHPAAAIDLQVDKTGRDQPTLQ